MTFSIYAIGATMLQLRGANQSTDRLRRFHQHRCGTAPAVGGLVRIKGTHPYPIVNRNVEMTFVSA